MPSVNGEDEPMARPMGVKAAKTKAKRPMGEEGKNLQELRQMWEIKAKDLIMKDKLSKTKLLDSLLAKTEPLSELEVALKNKLITEMLSIGIIPPLPQEDTDDDVADSTPTEVEVVEISDEEEEEEDMVELSFEEYMRNMGYLIRVEESVEDIEPEFRRMLKRMEQEEKKLREEKFKVLNSGIKLEVGQSSKGDGKKRKRRS
ncbi:hypothetical protein Bca4012_002803 [Brassica carinata]